ncbi:MAG: MBL fold metallo-hydrolase [Bryobacteraceae bacterium]|jgi:glyoxylase-like metal-dependent hydrolase (beta-lactamase superfamily II)
MGDLRRTRTRSLLPVGALLCLAALLSPLVFGQGAIGEFVPDAGFDLSGNWNPLLHEDFLERIPGPELVNYSGLPITEGARLWGESWSSSRLTMPEHQCQAHVVAYIYRGPLQMRFWDEKDPQSQKIIAIKNYISTYEQNRTIWMDGRPHPPAWAAHTWMGFSTGKWEGGVFTVYTTHIKQGWVRRDGLPESDEATLVEHFMRHGDHLTHVSILTDPVYLTEPLVKSEDYLLNTNAGGNWLYPCEEVEEVEGRPRGAVPNYLPGQNPFLTEYANMFHLPLIAALGGAETMYPEFEKVIKNPPAAPSDPLALAEVTPMAQKNMALNPNPTDGEVHVLPVQGNVYMLVGAGGNITVQVADMGVLMVDTGLAASADKVIAAIRKLSPDKPLQYIINTHVHPDHTGGNEKLRAAGTTITGANVTRDIADASQGAAIIAHQNILDRMSAPDPKKTGGGASMAPVGAWPTDTFLGDRKTLWFNDEPVDIVHEKNAHTDGDSIVFFRHSDVIATGDIFVTTGYPFIDLERGGSIQGELDALNNVLDLAISKHDEEGGTYIVPGHGRLCDRWDLIEYRDMVTIIRDRIQAMLKKGMTVEQVKAARPTMDYDARYGADKGFGATDSFVEAIYKSLSKK